MHPSVPPRSLDGPNRSPMTELTIAKRCWPCTAMKERRAVVERLGLQSPIAAGVALLVQTSFNNVPDKTFKQTLMSICIRYEGRHSSDNRAKALLSHRQLTDRLTHMAYNPNAGVHQIHNLRLTFDAFVRACCGWTKQTQDVRCSSSRDRGYCIRESPKGGLYSIYVVLLTKFIYKVSIYAH